MSIDITFMFLWWTFSKSIDRLIEYQIEYEECGGEHRAFIQHTDWNPILNVKKGPNKKESK